MTNNYKKQTIMITLQFKDDTYQLRNELDELTVGEFEKISSILNDLDKNQLEKWSEIFLLLGIPQDVIDYFDAETFISIIKQFNLLDEKKVLKTVEKVVTIDNVDYIGYDGDEFKMNVKQLCLIEDFIKKNPERYLGDILAVIYKSVNIDDNMHFDKAHIKHKAELFRKQMNAKYAMPLLGYISKKIINDTTILENGTVEEHTN